MQVAFLVDGGFLEKKLKKALNRFPLAQDIVDVCSLAMRDAEFQHDQLFRIYYYDCEPFTGTVIHPISGERIDYSASQVCIRRSDFLRNVKLMPRVAFRSGTLSFDGWSIPSIKIRGIINKIQLGQPLSAGDLVPNFRQKKVDIKIGLDIAWLASKRIVEKIVLITSDSDFVPAMKTARKEGVMIYLLHFGHQAKEELKEHCDGIIAADLSQLAHPQVPARA